MEKFLIGLLIILFKGLKAMQSPGSVAAKRGKSVEEIL